MPKETEKPDEKLTNEEDEPTEEELAKIDKEKLARAKKHTKAFKSFRQRQKKNNDEGNKEELTSDSMIYTYKKMANYLLGEAGPLVAAVAPVVRTVAARSPRRRAIRAMGTGPTRTATKALRAQEASAADLNASTEYSNPYVKKLMEAGSDKER